jgi:hypothetical protein
MPKQLIAAIAISSLAIAPHVALAQTAKDVSQKAAETGEAIRAYTIAKKDDAVAHAKKVKGDLDVAIKDLEADSARQAGEAKAKSEQLMKDVKAKQSKASAKLQEMGKASMSSWEAAKKGFADAYRDLAVSYDKAASEFKK